MPFITDEAFDAGLDYLDTNGVRIDVQDTAEATTYALATTDEANSLGNDTVAVPVPEAGATDGRRVVIPAITAGSVTGTGTAGWWALTDNSSILLATNALSATQGLTDLNTFSLDAINITFRDAVSV